jgi:hypothetical protein
MQWKQPSAIRAESNVREENMSEEKVEYEVEAEPIEVEVVDDTPEQDRGRKPMDEPPKEFSEDEIATYNESVQKRIKHFTKGYHQERRAKEAALREREEAARLLQATLEENKRLKSTVSQNQEALLEQAKRATQAELEKAKEDYKKAYDSGDSDGLVEAQENLTAAKIKADRVANFKLPPLQEEEPKLKPEQQPVYDPKANDWVQRNNWYGNDQRMTTYAWAVHEEMTKEGIPLGSDEYWNKLDAEIRQRFPEKFESSDAPTQKKSTVVAPATRSTAPKKIVLTQSQVNLAKRLGVSLEAMAKEVAKINRGNA